MVSPPEDINLPLNFEGHLVIAFSILQYSNGLGGKYRETCILR